MRNELRMFAQYMEHKLKLNDHKGGWEETSLSKLFELLRRELDELEQAIGSEPELNIMMEAADVANFAMMIAWNAARIAFLSSNVANDAAVSSITEKSTEDTGRNVQTAFPFNTL